MHSKKTACLLLFSAYSLCAQQNPKDLILKNKEPISKDLTSDLVSKGTFFMGFSSSLAFGIAFPENSFIAPSNFKPKIGYFIFDRLSVGLSYQGGNFNSTYAPRYSRYRTVELELNHYFYAKKNILLYGQAGLVLEHYVSSTYAPRTSLNYKLGGGISWRPKKTPNLGFNAEAAYYFGPTRRTQVEKIPNVTFGINYFFNSKKKKSSN